MISRRSFFGLLAAPAVIRVASLMPVSEMVWTQPKLDVIKWRRPTVFAYEDVSVTVREYGHMVIQQDWLPSEGPVDRFVRAEMVKWRRPLIFEGLMEREA